MRGSLWHGLLLVTVLLSGCAQGSPASRAPVESAQSQAVADPATALAPGGLRADGIVHDGPSDAVEASSALAAAKRELRDIAGFWYEYPESRPVGLPSTLRRLLRESTITVVPTYEYASVSTSAPTVFAVTRPAKRDYLLVLSRNGSIVGSCDWGSYLAERKAIAGQDPLWYSFYSEFESLDLSRPERLLRSYFGAGDIAVRVVGVPRGYWVIGNKDGLERAAFIGHQGYFDDDPRTDRLYTTGEVLAYGTPHGDGK